MIPDDVQASLAYIGIGGVNACFVVERHQAVTGFFTGYEPVALTRWWPYRASEEDTLGADVSVLFYASPDASGVFDLFLEGSALRGVGTDSYFDGEWHITHGGYLVGQRVGGVDLEICFEAARAQAR